MNIGSLFQQHPYAAAAVSTWLLNNIVTAFVAAFPAPTKDSSTAYIWWFRFSNGVMGNISRAKSTTVENSPNWQDAVQRAANGKPPA